MRLKSGMWLTPMFVQKIKYNYNPFIQYKMFQC